MAGALASGLIVSLLVSSYVFVKTSTFVFGFMFFGGPVLKEIMRYLDRRHAHWKKLLELQKYALAQRSYPNASTNHIPVQS